MQKTKSSWSTTTTYRGQRDLHPSTRNSTHRRQGDLLEIHPCVPKTFQALQPQDLPKALQIFQDIPIIHGIPNIPNIPVVHDIPASPGISTSSSISRHSLIRMHILQFDWFPQKLHRVPVECYKHFYKHYILQRKGDVAISVKLTRSLKIESTPISILSKDNTNCKNDIQ